MVKVINRFGLFDRFLREQGSPISAGLLCEDGGENIDLCQIFRGGFVRIPRTPHQIFQALVLLFALTVSETARRQLMVGGWGRNDIIAVIALVEGSSGQALRNARCYVEGLNRAIS